MMNLRATLKLAHALLEQSMSKPDSSESTKIQFLIENMEELDWDRIKTYADLFGEWGAIIEIKNKT
jgi:hypothetical protein